MALSPREVETKQFLVALRGYDVEEVRAFLGEVAAEMRLLLQALYASLPPGSAVDTPGQPDLDDLVALGSSISEEVVRLAEAGRAAQVDADEVRRIAESASQRIQASATEQRLTAVREAGRLIARAHQEAAEILARAQEREEAARQRLAHLDDQLGAAEEGVRALRSQVRAAAAAVPEDQP